LITFKCSKMCVKIFLKFQGFKIFVYFFSSIAGFQVFSNFVIFHYIKIEKQIWTHAATWWQKIMPDLTKLYADLGSLLLLGVSIPYHAAKHRNWVITGLFLAMTMQLFVQLGFSLGTRLNTS
jgi:hypothetical protein